MTTEGTLIDTKIDVSLARYLRERTTPEDEETPRDLRRAYNRWVNAEFHVEQRKARVPSLAEFAEMAEQARNRLAAAGSPTCARV